MVKTKRGWIRILEATISIMIISSVFIMLYTKQPQPDYSGEIEAIHEQIIMDIYSQKNLRLNVLNDNIDALNNFARTKIPPHLNFSIAICQLSEPCNLNPEIYKSIYDKEIFVEETIISAEIGQDSASINPKKIRLFIWPMV
jgi:hypothetical protein